MDTDLKVGEVVIVRGGVPGGSPGDERFVVRQVRGKMTDLVSEAGDHDVVALTAWCKKNRRQKSAAVEEVDVREYEALEAARKAYRARGFRRAG